MEISKEQFGFISAFARTQFGLNLPEAKMPLINSRLSRRVRKLGIQDFASYREILEDSQDEKIELLCVLTTNVTEFFREQHHFQTLKQELRDLSTRRISEQSELKIWCAGCSTGQEAYSIAITALESLSQSQLEKVKVFASDIDPKVLDKARSGTYTLDEVSKLPDRIQSRYFEANRQMFSASSEVRNMIQFFDHNLVRDPDPNFKAHIIFCRNVAIYFENREQQRLWSKFERTLFSRGLLFIGHSERLTGTAKNAFTGCGITTYRMNT